MIQKGQKRTGKYAAKYARRSPFTVGRSCAKQAGREWTLTEEQYAAIMGDRSCFYCGGKCRPNAGALDRVDPTLGYVPGNVVPCCQKCNSEKKDWPQSVFMAREIFHAYHGAVGSPGGEA